MRFTARSVILDDIQSYYLHTHVRYPHKNELYAKVFMY
jgi:hypothetical protein